MKSSFQPFVRVLIRGLLLSVLMQYIKTVKPASQGCVTDE